MNTPIRRYLLRGPAVAINHRAMASIDVTHIFYKCERCNSHIERLSEVELRNVFLLSLSIESISVIASAHPSDLINALCASQIRDLDSREANTLCNARHITGAIVICLNCSDLSAP